VENRVLRVLPNRASNFVGDTKVAAVLSNSAAGERAEKHRSGGNQLHPGFHLTNLRTRIARLLSRRFRVTAPSRGKEGASDSRETGGGQILFLAKNEDTLSPF